jgi:uncharacterized protein YbaP (TraB family)
MRRPSIIVVFLGLFLMAVQALAAERGALFKVSGSGHALYLYGTIHAGHPDYYPLEPRIRQALAAAPTLALEVDAAGNPAAMMAAMQQYGMYPEGQKGKVGLASLSPERRQKIEAGMRRQGLDPNAMGQLKPWVMVMTLAVIDAAKLGYDPRLGVDAHLAEQARANGKTRIAELESISYQAALIDRMSDDEQWKLLEETLENMASGRQLRETRDLFAAYDEADQAAQERIAQRVEEDDSVSGRFVRKYLMDERNGPMADKILALLARENNAVVAVGLLHLVGKRGVPELLRKRGVKVERIY